MLGHQTEVLVCYEAGRRVELQLFPEDLLCEGLAAETVKCYVTLRTEGLWEDLVQRSDVPGLPTGARIGRWLPLAWPGYSGKGEGRGEPLVQLMDCG